jgi:ABC-type glycerol-3-phosphate transport system substrate-binding protein
MKNAFRLAFGLAAAAALAGCVEETGTATMAPSPSGPPLITTYDPSVSNAAVDACRNALEADTGSSVNVVGSEFSQANSAVYMRVGANGAPWRCLVSNDGRGPELMFMGSEGAA